VNDWEEYPSGPPFGSRVVVTLLSDAILRGPDGQTNADLDGALSRLLELPDLKAQTSFLQIKTVSGFNRKWGLPLPQTWALAAGSVAVYRADDIDAQQLRAAVRDGIGERRAEGFGRLAVNWHTWPDLPFGKPITKADPRPRLKASSRALAQKMARRRLERVLEQGLVSRVSQAELGACPSNAQLSRVRNAAQQAFHSRSLEALSAHLAALRGAKEQLANAKVNGVPMFNWLEERISEMDIEAQLLGGQSLPRIAGVEAEIDTEMRVFYTSRLIDAVMQKAIRLNQREAA
jgi:CRISPR-associated protein Csx10